MSDAHRQPIAQMPSGGLKKALRASRMLQTTAPRLLFAGTLNQRETMQCHLILPRRRKNGKVITGNMWRARVKLDGQKKAIEIPLGVTDKEAAQAKLDAIRIEMEQEQAGLIPPKVQRETEAKELLHFLPDFIRSRETVGRSDRYLLQVENQCRRVFTECAWKNIRDVTPPSFEQWRSKLDASPITRNRYFEAVQLFLHWMVKMGRITDNPLRHVDKIDERRHEGRERRAMTQDEYRRLIQAAPKRAPIYTAAIFTMMRRSELGALQVRDIQLGPQPTFTVRASVAKNAKRITLPLHPEAVEALRTCIAPESLPMQRVFSDGMPDMDTFKRDLVKAGIEYVDGEGRTLDFHSLRKTGATWLQANGASSLEAKELMRHSELRLTTNTYTDKAQLPLRSALGKMYPDADTQENTQMDTQVCVLPPQTIRNGAMAEIANSALNLLQAAEDEPERVLAGLRFINGEIWTKAHPSGFEPETF